MFPINQKSINKLTALGMMTALVFVSNYLRITMPIAIRKPSRQAVHRYEAPAANRTPPHDIHICRE